MLMVIVQILLGILIVGQMIAVATSVKKTRHPANVGAAIFLTTLLAMNLAIVFGWIG